jgi:oxygen-dependent protoporphyrinogen oxidase
VNHPQNNPRRVAVVGGGISGLAAAHRLIELDPSCDLTLWEAGSRLGGVLSTVRRDGFEVEQSADNFITTVPWAVDLCKRLGLADQLVQTEPAHRRAYVVRRGRLHTLPDGFLMMAPARLWPLAVTPILSPAGKLRAALEYFIPPRRDEGDESMADFVRRRLGREAFERLVEPLVSSVYAADMEKLSVLATLPQFREMERRHGSLIRAMRRQIKARRQAKTESGARYSMFVTLREGLSSLVEAIAARLPDGAVRLRAPVGRIERIGNGWRLWAGATGPHPSPLPGGEGDPLGEQFDAVIVAAPSGTAARLLRPIDATLARQLASIEHSGTAVVSLGYDRNQVGHPLLGAGAVVPAIEQSPILAVSFSSQKYAHRAPQGKVLLRVFLGGARRPELAKMDDQELLPLVSQHLTRLLEIRGQPCFCDVAHWPGTMPQYHVGHRELVAQIEARTAALPNFQLAGNAYHGVGIPVCIHSGQQAAERLLAATGR